MSDDMAIDPSALVGLLLDEPHATYDAPTGGGEASGMVESFTSQGMGSGAHSDVFADVCFDDVLSSAGPDACFVQGMALEPPLAQNANLGGALSNVDGMVGGLAEQLPLVDHNVTVARAPASSAAGTDAAADASASGASSTAVTGSKRTKRKTRADVQARRRELNRNNAKKSRLRQKFKMQSLVLRVRELEEENKALRALCKMSHIDTRSASAASSSSSSSTSLGSSSASSSASSSSSSSPSGKMHSGCTFAFALECADLYCTVQRYMYVFRGSALSLYHRRIA
jgi:hypothetical protein